MKFYQFTFRAFVALIALFVLAAPACAGMDSDSRRIQVRIG